MTLKEITDILEATTLVYTGDPEDLNILSACSADLMSDVLYYHAPNSLLLTGLTQQQVIRTAEIAGIKAIVLILDKKPDIRTIELAQQKGIPMIGTRFCAFTACGKLYTAGLRSARDE